MRMEGLVTGWMWTEMGLLVEMWTLREILMGKEMGRLMALEFGWRERMGIRMAIAMGTGIGM